MDPHDGPDKSFPEILREMDRALGLAKDAATADDAAYAKGYRDGLAFALAEAKNGCPGAGESFRDLYESILRSAPDVIAITNLESKILMVSQSVEKMFGWAEEELIGHSITEFIVSQDQERARDRIDLMFRGIMTGPGEYRGIRKNGSVFTIEVNAEIVKDAERRPSKLVFIIRDAS